MNARPKMTALAALATLLATLSLAPLFSDAGWFPPTLIVILLVALAGALTRQFRLPAPGEALLAAVFVFDFVTVWFAPQHAQWGVLPSRDTLHDLHVLLRDAGSTFATITAPAPSHDGLVLLTVLCVAALAFVVDLAAVTARVPALTGLPFIAAYAVASGLAPHGVGALPFLAGAAGWLTLLLADHRDRLSRWGRPLRPGGTETLTGLGPAEGAPLSAAGRRIGAAALGIAVIVPLVLPGMTHVRFGHGNGLGNGGSSSVTTFNPLVSIRDELNRSSTQRLLVVGTDDATPDYLRMTTLDRFDGTVWSSSQLKEGPKARVSNGIPVSSDTTGTPSRTVDTHVHVVALAVHWLPLPAPPSSVSIAGDWRYDPRSGTVFSAREDTQGADYTVVSDRLIPDVTALRDAPPPGPNMRDYLQLPKSLSPAVARIARQQTAGAHTAFDKAVALQDWLRGPQFTYDTTVAPGNSDDAILEFLDRRHGFCEQFAATMAVMARTLGIPARVAVGFTPGQLNPDGTRTVTTDDAHAWPELYFPRTGWLRFEPTPRSDGQATTPAYTLPASAGGQGNQEDVIPTPGPSSGPQPSTSAPPITLPTDPAAVSTRGGGLPWRALALLALLGVVLAVPGATREAVRRRRWLAAADPRRRAHAAWAELRDDVVDLGFPWWPSDSPRGTGRRLADRVDLSAAGAAALSRVVRAEERARYAPAGPDADADGLATDVRAVRHDLRAAVSRRRRVLAVVLPVSTLRRAGSAVGAAVERVFEAFDAFWPAVLRWGRARLRTRPQ